MSDVTTRSFDFSGLLAHLTNGEPDQWVEVDGPESGSGLDYWFANDATGAQAYINLDQEYLTVSVDDERVFAEEIGDLDPDHPAARFLSLGNDVSPAP